MAHELTEAGMERRNGPLEGSRSIFVVTFIAFLMLALVSLVSTQNWRTLLPGAEGAHSMLGGVRSAVYTVMSQLI
jgi:hypothetical protein